MSRDFTSLFKLVLLGILIILLALPAVQAKWHFLTVRPLHGYFELSPRPAFTWTDLRANTYQGRIEKYLDDRLGFREWAIRSRNQIAYTLFGVVHANDVILGQRNVLYQGGPVEAYLGHDYLGPEEIRIHAQRVRNVQDSLARHGVEFLYVIAPGKPRFQPEDLPPHVKEMWPNPTNYAGFAAALPKVGVHVLDIASLFQKWKPKAAHPLFPRGGTHWSCYGITLAADTLFGAIESLTRVDLPSFKTTPGIITTDSLRSTDNDIVQGLNLIWEPTPYPMAYPILTFAPLAPSQQRLNMLLIGDSFAQSLYLYYPYLQNMLDSRSSRFWYYNEYTYWPATPPDESRVVHELNLREQVEKQQLVVVFATEQNLSKRSFGFIDEVYNTYHPVTAAGEARIQKLMKQYKAELSWEESTKITDEQLHQRAILQYERER